MLCCAIATKRSRKYDERANCRYFASPFRYSRALVQLTRISRALGRYRRCEELDVVLNELTDLPDDAEQISELAGLNARIRTEGTWNLIEAGRRSGSPKILAQSVAWQLPEGPDAQAVAELERSILAEGGVVLRYGQFYGPGTYNEQQPPKEPRVHIDRAADRTAQALGEPTGIVVITD